MRLVLFEMAGARSALCMDQVLQVLQEPRIWPLPCLRAGFAGVFLHQGQIVPLLAATGGTAPQGQFVLICEAPFGLVGLPAEKIERITSAGELDDTLYPGPSGLDEMVEINGRSYCRYDLDQLLETATA